jgi:hypothetical protein
MPVPVGNVAATGIAAYSMFDFLKHMFEDSAAVENIVAQMKAALFTDGQIEFSKQLAHSMVRSVPGMGYAEGLDLINQTKSFTGEFGTAASLAPTLARDAQVLQVYGQGEAIRAVEQAIKAGELTGLTGKDGKLDLDRLMDFVNKLTELTVSTKGQFNIGQFLTGIRQFGVGADAASVDFLTNILPVYMQILGNAKAGTALQSFEQAMDAPEPKMQNKKLFAEQRRIGLRDSKTNKPIEDELLHTDPNAYFVNVLLPLLMKAGFTTNEQIEGELYKLFPRQTMDRLAAAGMFDRALIEKEVDRNRAQQAAGTAPLDELLKNSPSNQWKAFTEAFKEFMAAAGSAAMPMAISGLRSLTDVLHALADFTNAHPNLATGLVAAIGILASALAVLTIIAGLGLAAAILPRLAGAFAMFGVGGVAAAGLVALVAGLGALANKFGWFNGKSVGPNDQVVTPNSNGSQEPNTIIVTPKKKVSYVPPANNNGGGMIHNVIYMDGKAVADTVTSYQEKTASAPSIGPSLYDPSVTQPWPHHDWTA